MINALETEILFDDLAIIEAMHGTGHLDKMSITDHMDCTNNRYATTVDEEFSAEKIA